MANHDTTALLAARSRSGHKGVWIGVFAAWMTAGAVAFAALTDYAVQPGFAARAPTSWPAASRLERAPHRKTLVMIAHTKCSCTRASLHELARVMSDVGSRIDAIVVFVGPNEGSGAGGILDLRATARAIPNVRVVESESEARLFGAATSGQALFYDESGALVFRGGLTPARGHEGDSAGGDIVRRLAAPGARPSASSGTPIPASNVFGCSLFDHSNNPPRKDP